MGFALVKIIGEDVFPSFTVCRVIQLIFKKSTIPTMLPIIWLGVCNQRYYNLEASIIIVKAYRVRLTVLLFLVLVEELLEKANFF